MKKRKYKSALKPLENARRKINEQIDALLSDRERLETIPTNKLPPLVIAKIEIKRREAEDKKSRPNKGERKTVEEAFLKKRKKVKFDMTQSVGEFHIDLEANNIKCSRATAGRILKKYRLT